MIHEFRLSPLGKGGISCDEGGAFVGAVPMLVRTHRHGREERRPRDCDDLSHEMSGLYGLPIDMSLKSGGLRAIANAFNDGDMARAQVATLLLRIPNPPSLSKGAQSRQEMIKLAGELHWGGLLKGDWNPDQHPRWPAGAPDSQGGQFAPKGDDEIGALPTSQGNRTGQDNSRPDRTHPDTRIHLADAGVSDASDDPMAQAAARAAEEAQRNASAQARPASSEHESVWQRFGSELSEETKALFAGIGRTQIKQTTADLVTVIRVADEIAHAVRAYEEYRAQPLLSANGQPVQVPVISAGDILPRWPVMMGDLSKPNPLLLRPATNADWIDPLVDLASLAGMIAGPELRLAGTATEVVDGVEVSANAAAEVADAVEVSANAAETAFETTEAVAVSGRRAIDRSTTYEKGVRSMYGDVPFKQRKFEVVMDGKEVKCIADNTTLVNGKSTAVEAKYVDDWLTSLRNPASKDGGEPWAVKEQLKMVRQAKAYSLNFPGRTLYHTNDVDLAVHYTNVFRKSGIRNFRFVITPATRMSKKMAKNYMERIFGAGAFEYERKVPGTRPGEEVSVRYVSFDDPASIPKLFHEVLNKIRPKLVKTGGATLEGTLLELPDGSQFFAIQFNLDLEGWRKQIELGAKELGRATAKVLGGDVIVCDGRSYPLSSCKVVFE
jgi:hypothetical protein